MARPDKAAAVAEMTEAFRGSSAAVLTEYRGLTVAQLKELRRALAGNATYSVVKNTLSKIAARDAGLDTLEPMFEGPSAIAFVTGDPVEVAKGLRDFARTNPLLVVKGGVLDGKPLSADEIKRLADLESRPVLLAKLAGAMNGNLAKAASLFQAPLSQAVRLAEALRQKAEEDPGVLAAGAGRAAGDAAADAADTQPGVEAGTSADATGGEAPAQTDVTPAADGELPTDGTPGVESTPEPAPQDAGDPGAEAQAVADATDIAPDTDVADGATSTS